MSRQSNMGLGAERNKSYFTFFFFEKKKQQQSNIWEARDDVLPWL